MLLAVGIQRRHRQWTMNSAPSGFSQAGRINDAMETIFDEDGEEHLKRFEFSSCTTELYRGPEGERRLVEKELRNGNKEFYEGCAGEEHMVRKEFPIYEGRQNKQWYAGPKGKEYMTRKVDAKLGYTAFFEDSNPKLVLIQYLDGTKEYYEGGQNEEYLVRKDLPNGVKKHYKGACGKERLVRTE